jgi:hypothetical protein
MKMCLGNGLGFEFGSGAVWTSCSAYCYGSFIMELKGGDCAGYLRLAG